MLTRERMERMIDAKDSGEAAKVLSECGYGELTQLTSAALEELLADARRNTFRDMADSVPDRRLVEVFQLKYDYHNAKVLIKAQAMGLDEARLLSQGGRYDPQRLREDFLRDDLRDWGEVFRQAVLRAREVRPPPEILSRPTWCWTGPAFRRWRAWHGHAVALSCRAMSACRWTPLICAPLSGQPGWARAASF